MSTARGLARAAALTACIACPATGLAMQAPAAATTAPLPAAVQNLQHDVQQQQRQNRQLHQRVDVLERRQAEDRDKLQQRDRAIEALRRQLEQRVPAPATSAARHRRNP